MIKREALERSLRIVLIKREAVRIHVCVCECGEAAGESNTK